MLSTTTIIITRPTTDIPFFYDSDLFTSSSQNWLQCYRDHVLQGTILDHMKTVSDDNLTMRRVIIYIDARAKTIYCDAFYTQFPEYLSIRSDYCNAMGHTLQVIEE
jgi:hypothetical protein